MFHLLTKIDGIWSGRNLNDRDKTLKTSLPPCFWLGREIKKKHIQRKKEAYNTLTPELKTTYKGFKSVRSPAFVSFYLFLKP